MPSNMTRRGLIAAGVGLTTPGLLVGTIRKARAMRDAAIPNDMVLIPAGKFLMGTSERDAERLAARSGYHPSWLSGEVPQRETDVSAFLIDRYPVTNRQFAEFCEATGHRSGGKPTPDMLDHPVLFVHRGDCLAYARWAGKRLPTEAEWEKAARGGDGRLYPWGDRFRADACNWKRTRVNGLPGTAPVTAFPQGASPYGVMDMAGNAAEWCVDSPGLGSGIIKGGCWLTQDPLNLRSAARNMSGFDNNGLDFYGFRCAKEVA